MKLRVVNGSWYFTDGTAGRRIRGQVHSLVKRHLGQSVLPVTNKAIAWQLASEVFNAVHNTPTKRFVAPVGAVREYLGFRSPNVSALHLDNLNQYLTRFLAESQIQSVTDINETVVSGFIDSLDCHPHTKNKYLSGIQGFCKWAKRRGYLSSVPTRDIQRMPERDTRVGRIITKDEIALLCANTDHFFAAIIAFAVATGLRRGEIMYLWRTGWEGLDIKRAMYELPAEATKTRRAVKNPMSNEAVEAAKRMCEYCPVNVIYHRDFITHKFYQLTQRLSIKARFHDLRHTFNARLGMLSLSPGTRARLMNQSTPDLSETRYHHDTEEYLRRAVNAIPEL